MGNIEKILDIKEIVNVINKDNDFFFIPWIGKNYGKNLNEKKLLVVGASHYCNHSNVCIHPYNNKECSINSFNRCNLGCDFFHDCTNGNTRIYNEYCPWMKKEEYSKSYEILCTEISNLSDNNGILEKLNSTTIGEVCIFLDSKCEDNNSFKKFTDFCCKYFNCKSSDFWKSIAFVNYAQNFQPNSTGNRFLKTDYESFKAYIKMLNPHIVIVWGCALGNELKNRGLKKETKNYDYNWENDGIRYVNSYHPSYRGFKDNGRLKKSPGYSI